MSVIYRPDNQACGYDAARYWWHQAYEKEKPMENADDSFDTRDGLYKCFVRGSTQTMITLPYEQLITLRAEADTKQKRIDELEAKFKQLGEEMDTLRVALAVAIDANHLASKPGGFIPSYASPKSACLSRAIANHDRASTMGLPLHDRH